MATYLKVQASAAMHAIRVGYTRRKNDFEGSTTAAVTFLGNPQ